MGRAYQNRKESMSKTSDMKAKIYSRYSREIYMCAKSGGTEPTGNLALASLLERAKKEQVPAHVIDKAIAKAAGGGGEDFAVARYEGFGPGNTMIIVDCLTDNPNRTYGDVRTCFNKVKAKLGASGAVSHLFDHSAIFSFSGPDEDAVLEALADADVDVTDIEAEDGVITVFAPQTEFAKTRNALKGAFEGIEFDVEDIQFIPQVTTAIEGEDAEQFEKMLDLLNYLDDVQQVYHNADY
ncbi:YebC/PmpR family DNA-binding transcriptional regulator [Marinimicrobium locisalis]|uniref:YebC/PmpR family DNA-binding transcriptional regulator n=1 Tax=Marinimicrobium locisalis TaxID=546022 RepID=UPI003221A4D0